MTNGIGQVLSHDKKIIALGTLNFIAIISTVVWVALATLAIITSLGTPLPGGIFAAYGVKEVFAFVFLFTASAIGSVRLSILMRERYKSALFQISLTPPPVIPLAHVDEPLEPMPEVDLSDLEKTESGPLINQLKGNEKELLLRFLNGFNSPLQIFLEGKNSFEDNKIISSKFFVFSVLRSENAVRFTITSRLQEQMSKGILLKFSEEEELFLPNWTHENIIALLKDVISTYYEEQLQFSANLEAKAFKITLKPSSAESELDNQT